jgi:hypothetical protein
MSTITTMPAATFDSFVVPSLRASAKGGLAIQRGMTQLQRRYVIAR